MAEGKINSDHLRHLRDRVCAPIRDQIRIDIPIIVSKVSYIGAAFPTIKPQGNFLPYLTVAADGSNYVTKDDLQHGQHRRARLQEREQPVVIAKTIASAVAKATAAYVANDAGRQQGDVAGLLVQLSTAIYQMAVNIADTRTWTTLPRGISDLPFSDAGEWED